MSHISPLTHENTYLHLQQLVRGAINNPESTGTLLTTVANLLNDHPHSHVLEKVKKMFSIFAPPKFSTVKQLSEFLDRMTISDGSLKLNIRPLLSKSCPQCFTIGKNFKLQEVILTFLPKKDEEALLFWKGVSNLQALPQISIDPDEGNYDDELLAPLVEMPSLKTLKIGHWLRVHDNPKPNLQKLTQLTALHFESSCTDATTENFVHMPLQTLVMSHSYISSPGFQNISKITTLQQLVISMTNLHGDYSGISSLKQLRSFCNWSENLNSQSMQELSKCPLESLSLRGPMGLENIQAIFKMLHLKILRLSNIEFSDASWSGIENLQDLVHLELSGCKNIEKTLLEKISGLRQLAHLELDHCERLNSGYEHFQNLRNLRFLNISYGPAPKEAFEVIAKLPLETLNVSGCANFSDESLINLSLHCRTLKELSLTSTPITDKGLENLPGLTSLHTLNLGLCSQLSFEGLKHVLPQISSLRNINLPKELTDEEIEALCDAAPQIESANWLFWGLPRVL